MKNQKLTPGRLRCLQGLAFGALKLSIQRKDALVEQHAPGKTRFHELTNAEADKVIDAMKLLAGQTPTRPIPGDRRRARAGGVATLITPAQRELLGALTRELLAAGHSSVYLAAIRERACRRPEPVTSDDAERAIEALKAVRARAPHPQEPA